MRGRLIWSTSQLILFLREEDAEAALENALRDEPGWAGTLTVEPVALDERAVSAN